MSDVVAPENDLTTTLLDAEIFHPRTFCTMLSPQITVTGFLSALVEWCSLVEVSSDGLGELLFATADFVGWRPILMTWSSFALCHWDCFSNVCLECFSRGLHSLYLIPQEILDGRRQ